MRSYYQMSGEEVLQEVNGSLEPLTNEQVREHQEQYGPKNWSRERKRRSYRSFWNNIRTFWSLF